MMWDQSSFATAREQARDEYERLYRQGVLRQWMRSLFGLPSRLLELDEVRKHNRSFGASYGGVRTVPIAQIRGSEGRSGDFDAVFRPLQLQQRDRWASIAECRRNGVPLPAVVLVRVEDMYFVRDGHHRISVARRHGQLEIEAEITIWHGASLPEMQAECADRSGHERGFWQLPAAANRAWGRVAAMAAETGRRLLDVGARSPQLES